jgi:hypothetical protein
VLAPVYFINSRGSRIILSPLETSATRKTSDNFPHNRLLPESFGIAFISLAFWERGDKIASSLCPFRVGGLCLDDTDCDRFGGLPQNLDSDCPILPLFHVSILASRSREPLWGVSSKTGQEDSERVMPQGREIGGQRAGERVFYTRPLGEGSRKSFNDFADQIRTAFC